MIAFHDVAFGDQWNKYNSGPAVCISGITIFWYFHTNGHVRCVCLTTMVSTVSFIHVFGCLSCIKAAPVLSYIEVIALYTWRC